MGNVTTQSDEGSATVTVWCMERALDGDMDNEEYVLEAIDHADKSEPDADVFVSAVTAKKALDGDIDHINYLRRAIADLDDDSDIGIFPD